MLQRNLYRVAAVVEEKALHRLLVFLAELKTYNVECAAVTSPTDEAAPAAITPPPAAPNRNMTIRQAILAAMHRQPPMKLAELHAALPWFPRSSVSTAASLLAKERVLRRVGHGKYAMTARGNGAAPPAQPLEPPAAPPTSEQTAIGPGKTRGMIIAALARAPGQRLTRAELMAAIAAADPGKSIRSLDGALHRMKHDKIVRNSKPGEYQLAKGGTE
jgi:hypothetical protein